MCYVSLSRQLTNMLRCERQCVLYTDPFCSVSKFLTSQLDPLNHMLSGVSVLHVLEGRETDSLFWAGLEQIRL